MAYVQRTTPRSIFCSLQCALELNRQPLHFLCSGTTFVWVNSAISSLWANLYDDWIKAIFQKSGTFHLLGRRTGLVVLWTFLFIVLLTCFSTSFLRFLWDALKRWWASIDTDGLVVRNALYQRRWERWFVLQAIGALTLLLWNNYFRYADECSDCSSRNGDGTFWSLHSSFYVAICSIHQVGKALRRNRIM